MSVFRNVVRQVIPDQVREVLWGVYSGHYVKEFAQKRPEQEWNLNPKAVLSRYRLHAYKNCHRGQRCFIIGNGPSLNRMDLGFLRKEFTFGLNRSYLLFPRIGFHTTYYVAVNQLVIEQCARDIENLEMPRFISWCARDKIRFTPGMMFIRDPYDSADIEFSTDPSKKIYEGATVTYVAMQLAYYMGFKKIILIGVDHSFATKGKPHETVVSTGADPDHFDPTYFGKGFQWQLPDLEASERAYRLAKYHFDKSGRQILDATVDGALQVFPKVDYRSLF